MNALLYAIPLMLLSYQAQANTLPTDWQADDVITTLPASISQQTPLLDQVSYHSLTHSQLADKAMHYIQLGRQTNDPRYYGYAQRLLNRATPEQRQSIDMQLVSAILQQHQHDFEGAIKTLQKIVQKQPKNHQAWLFLSQIQVVTGQYQAATQSCNGLSEQRQFWLSGLCLSQIYSLTGQAENALKMQTAWLVNQKRQTPNPTLLSWGLTLQAETTARLGHVNTARELYQLAHQQTPTDDYLLRSYSRFLLNQQDYQAVITLLNKTEAQSDNISFMLRRAIATKQLNQTTTALANQIEQNFDATRRRQESNHDRDLAQFWLHLKNDPQQAHHFAQRNWQQQKEIEDLQLLIETTLATSDIAQATNLKKWLNSTQFNDAHLAPLIQSIHTLAAS